MRPLLALFMLWPALLQAKPACLKEGLQALRPGVENWYMPQGAMKPALEPLECFISRRPSQVGGLAPGQVVVFWEDSTRANFVFRVIALEGQTVQIRDGVIFIDDAPVPRRKIAPYQQVMTFENGILPRCPSQTPIGETCLIDRYEETLNGRTYETLDLGRFPLDDTTTFLVPDGHVFVMGDNRDNATDSRVPSQAMGRGFVPVDRIIGVVPDR